MCQMVLLFLIEPQEQMGTNTGELYLKLPELIYVCVCIFHDSLHFIITEECTLDFPDKQQQNREVDFANRTA